MRRFCITGSLFLVLGCGDGAAPVVDAEPDPTSQLAPVADGIDAEALMAAIEMLASDEFGGRAR